MSRLLDTIVDLIVRCCDPREIVLFGSEAKGTSGPGSDIDLLVVGDFPEPRPLRTRRIDDVLARFPVKFDVHLVTPEELAAATQQPFSFLGSIRLHGVTLYRKV